MTALPPPTTRRWVARRKAAVVAAVSSGMITIEELTMDLPIKFPSETEVILEEVVRDRDLSPAERIRMLWNFLHSGAQLARRSPKAAFARQYAEGQEVLAQRNIQEFMRRHGY